MGCQEGILNFHRSKWAAPKLIALVTTVAIASAWWLGRSESLFHDDRGNGVVIYADDFVKTGKWVFDCSNSRLISREPLPAPTEELRAFGKITSVINILVHGAQDKAEAFKFIDSLESSDYKGLRYLYSGLDEQSELRFHTFYLLKAHAGRTWVAEITQALWRGGTEFYASAKPYDAVTYVDHEKALKAAAVSCPKPQ